ncbi:hypothetical protein D3C80_1234550 [compost metagenome]
MVDAVMRQAGDLADIPAFHQPLGQLAETGAEHRSHRLLDIDAWLGQGAGQFVRLLTATAPEGQLAQVMEQGRDEDLLLVPCQHIAGNIARLYGRMKRAREQFLQLFTRSPGEQAIDKAHGETDQAYIVEADQDDGPRDGLDGFLRRVVIGAIADSQHLGRQRGIAQQDVRQLLDRRVLLLRQALQILHHRSQGR